MEQDTTLATRIIHKPSNLIRKQRLDNDLHDFDDLFYVTAESIDPLFPNFLYSGGSPSEWNKKFSLLFPNVGYRRLNTSEIFNYASHYLALSSFSKKWCLVLEDDAIVPPRFHENLLEIIASLPQSADVIYLGGGFPYLQVLNPILLKGKLLRSEHPCTNTSCAYLISRRAALRALPWMYPFDAPIDVEFAFIQMRLNFEVYHCYPYIVEEGSKSIYRSTIERQ